MRTAYSSQCKYISPNKIDLHRSFSVKKRRLGLTPHFPKPKNSSFFPLCGFGNFSVYIAHRTMAYAFLFPFHTNAGKELLSFPDFKFLFCPVNPNAFQPKGVRCQHHTPCDRSVIIGAVRQVLIRKHNFLVTQSRHTR